MPFTSKTVWVVLALLSINTLGAVVMLLALLGKFPGRFFIASLIFNSPSPNAFAYIDPGTGSIIVQMIIGGLVGVVVGVLVGVVVGAVSYTHLRAHETVLDVVCRLLLEK